MAGRDDHTPRTIQARLGHASIVETLDTYGHLFPMAEEDGRGVLDQALTPSTSTIMRSDRGLSDLAPGKPQVRGLAADESACKPGSVPSAQAPKRRPSLSGCRCRQPLAVYPEARAGRPRTLPV